MKFTSPPRSERHPLAPRRAGLALLFSLALIAAPAAAQYMYLDTDGDGVHTPADVVHPSGATTVDIWLRTDANRDGSPAICATGAAPFNIYSYMFVLDATNGTIAWGAYVNRMADFGTQLPQGATSTSYINGFQGIFALDPGTYRVGTLSLSVASGTPSLAIVPNLPGDLFLTTGFESWCLGHDGGSKLKLGPDWTDVDGLPYGGVANHAPSLAAIADMTVAENSVEERPLSATDEDGEALTFALDAGPAFASVTTTDPGSGTAAGALRVAPGYADAGAAAATISVTDGIASAARSITITVANTDRAPVLEPITDMMTGEGVESGQLIYAADIDEDDLTFTKVSGPTYMRVQTLPPTPGRGFGNINLTPGYSDAGMQTGTVRVSDGVMSDVRSFNIMVRNANRPPELAVPGTQSVSEGDALQFQVTASDPDAEFPTLSASGLPPGGQFHDRGDGTGRFTWAPGFDQSGSHGVSFAAADPIGAMDQKSVTIEVTDRTSGTVLAQPLDLEVAEGEAAEQTLRAMDGDGSPLQFSLISGPIYATVSTTAPGAGLATGLLRAAPGYFDSGTAEAIVAVSDGAAEDRKSLRIIVANSDGGPAPGTPPFGPSFPIVPTGATPHTAALLDINQDGLLDIVNTNLGAASVSVHLGRGDGTFGERMSHATELMPHTVAMNDFNRDGIEDLIVSNMGDTTVGVLLGRGDMTFEPHVGYEMGGSPMILALGDLNHDGLVDVAVTNRTRGVVPVLLGVGDGTFRFDAEYVAGAGSHGMALADLTGDGNLDMLVCNEGAGTVSAHIGRGDGTFAPKMDLRTSSPHIVAVGAIDGDAVPDAAIANFGTGTVSVLLGNGDGTFRNLGEIPTGSQAHGVTMADLDQDGKTDLLVANQGAGTLSYLPGHGDGTFGAKTDFPSGAGAHYAAVGDLNSDGSPDVAVSSIFSNTVTLYFNRRPGLAGRRAPAAEAGGPYRGTPGLPVTFDAGASTDPDGDPLTFRWSFGDGANGLGESPSHAYAHEGRYRVSLLASDGVLTAADSASADIRSVLSARAFVRGPARTVPIGAGAPFLEIRLEPVEGAFRVEDLDLASLTLMSPGNGIEDRIACMAGKTVVDGDADRNGVAEAAVRFARADLARLLSRVEGRRTVSLIVEGRLVSGGAVEASMELNVVATGRPLAASVYPNPLNPSAILSLRTTRPGPVRVTLFNVSGQRVRTLLDGVVLPAGMHEVPVDGSGDGGARLPSGVYLFRIEAAEGVATGRLAIIR